MKLYTTLEVARFLRLTVFVRSIGKKTRNKVSISGYTFNFVSIVSTSFLQVVKTGLVKSRV